MLEIAAIMVVRNGAPTLARVLGALSENRIDVFAIDHGSVDDTPRILTDHSPSPVVEITTVPFDGVHRWRQNLSRKVEIAGRLPHGWIIHIDADEIMESPREGESLREMIERIDRSEFDVVECDEFVFVPVDDDEDHTGGDFVVTMRHYYHFAPKRHMQRAIRAGSDSIEWAETGGHRAGTDRHPADERIRLRHYIGLSIDHLRQQYLGRVFGAEELQRGWHHNRVATTLGFVTPPARERLMDLDVDGWRYDRPEARHLVIRQRKPFVLPGPLPHEGTHPPMPFIVGVGRSGTTLLRLMLDAHPDLAITPETHWLVKTIEALDEAPSDVLAIRKALTANDFWADMHVAERELDAILAEHEPSFVSDTVRSIYRVYADHHGARRVGDKTPNHGLAMTTIARVLPEARFVHLIRDGRDVALSHRGLWFGPGDSPRDAAMFWLWRIREMRQQAQFLPHYLEIHYEDLVLDPEATLRRICAFIDLPFHDNQLQAHRKAGTRLREIGGRSVGGRRVSARRRRSIHRRTESPPDPSRIGRWRSEMPASDVRAFERVAAIMLLDLGYELADPPPSR